MIVVARMKVQSGKESEFETMVKEIIPQVEKEEGTLQYTLSRAQANPLEYLFFEKYRDQEAINSHMTTEYFKEMSKKLAGVLDGAPVIEIFEEVDGIPLKV